MRGHLNYYAVPTGDTTTGLVAHNSLSTFPSVAGFSEAAVDQLRLEIGAHRQRRSHPERRRAAASGPGHLQYLRSCVALLSPDVARSLRGLDYLVRLSHERQYVIGQLYARCVYEAAARGLDCNGSEGHRAVACDTECFRHQDSDVDRAGVGVRSEDDRQEGSQSAVQTDDLIAGEGFVPFGALILDEGPLVRDRRLRLVTYPGSVPGKGELVGAEIVISQ